MKKYRNTLEEMGRSEDSTKKGKEEKFVLTGLKMF